MQIGKPIKLNDTQTKEWMVILLQRAKEAGNDGEVPITAIILDEIGRCIGHGRNNRNKRNDPLGHAELIALRQAAWVKEDWRFNECTLIVTLEPCQMCAGALIQARMGRVIFGAEDLKRGGLGGAIDLCTDKSAHHKMDVIGGVMREQIKEEIQNWFALKRIKSLKT